MFTLEALRETWLPTPRFILTEFFDRKLRQPNPNWPADAAKPERYFKYTPANREKDAGGKRQDVEDEEEDMESALLEAEDEWADEESTE